MGIIRPNSAIIALLAIVGIAIALISGCARSPENATPATGRRLVISMSVSGEINPAYHYYVAFDTSGASAPGPLPAVAPPWGNGWGTGAITDYVVFDGLQAQGGYALYRIVPAPDDSLSNIVYRGVPISTVIPPTGANRLQFTIDIGQLATEALSADQIDMININFITTDILPLSPNYPGPKYFDGLGDAGNNFINISVRTNQIYSNSRSFIESSGDVPIPDLDIIDWSVEVLGN